MSALNSALYNWDLYLCHGHVDYLKAAAVAMNLYRAEGGLDYTETEEHIRAHVTSKKLNIDEIS